MNASDFANFFYPALQAWLRGENPYMAVYNPLWAWWLMTPAGAWPLGIGFWLWLLVEVAVLVAALGAIGRARPVALVLLLLSPAALVHLVMGQWAAWLLLGTFLLQERRPALGGVGLFLLALKPNIGWPFLLLARRGGWVFPLAGALLSLALRPAWPWEAWQAFRTVPPVGYERLLLARSLGLGPGFLLALALLVTGVAVWAVWRYEPGRRWRIALICCVALFLTPYHRLYDNVLLFYPILLLTASRPGAWVVILPLLWLPLLLVAWPWAVFVDWLPPLVILLLLVRHFAQSRSISGAATAL